MITEKPHYYVTPYTLNGCGISEESEKRKDCHFYHEEPDMGAHIPCCIRTKKLGVCPCSPECKDYISEREINQVISDYIKRKTNAD